MEEQEKRQSTMTRSKALALAKRLALGSVVVLCAALLILWDAGVIVIPGLPPRARRKPAETGTGTGTADVLPVVVDYAAWTRDLIEALYDQTILSDPMKIWTTEAFDASRHSLVREAWNGEENISAFAGVLLAEKDGVVEVLLPDSHNSVTNSSIYRSLGRTAPDGSPVFEKVDDGSLWTFNVLSPTFLPFTPPLLWEKTEWETVPADTGDGSGLTLVEENGLFGYVGSFVDGRNTVPVTVPCEYTIAFPYREGIALMADADGRLTLRNARGEVIFSHRGLALPENWQEDESVCFFNRGLLPTVFATFGEDGALLQQSEGILTNQGTDFSLPDGYSVVAYQEGIFVVTNGSFYGYYSAGGNWVGTPSYEYAAPFREGIAAVTGEDGKMGLIDSRGKVILPCAFEEISSFSRGMAVITDPALGQVILWKVDGLYPPPGVDVPTVSDRTFYERVPISRGPQNTFDDGDETIIVLPELDRPPWETTAPTTTTRTIPPPTEPKPTEPKPTEPEPTEPKPTEPTPSEPASSEPASSSEPAGETDGGNS